MARLPELACNNLVSGSWRPVGLASTTMKHDRVELMFRDVVAAILYAAGKTAIVYFFFASVAENLTEELPRHGTAIGFAAIFFAAVVIFIWVLRPFYVLVVHRRDLG